MTLKLGPLFSLLVLVLAPAWAAREGSSHARCVDHARPADGLSGYWSTVETDLGGFGSEPFSQDEEDNEPEDNPVVLSAFVRISLPVHFVPVAAERSLIPISPAADPRAPRSPPSP
jgi:hypothetical protein